MNPQQQPPATGSIEEYILGPRMKASVIDRLEDTLVTFGHASPHLEKIHDLLLQGLSTDEFSPLSLTEIVNIVAQEADKCRLAKKLHENLVRDIYMRAKHYRKWRGGELYLSDNFVLSSDISVQYN